jgi:hypothetical protein
MLIRHDAQGKFYTIECPEGTRVVRGSEQPSDGMAVSNEAHPGFQGGDTGGVLSGVNSASDRISGLPATPISPFFLGHGNEPGIQCVFMRAGRVPG